MNTVFGNVIEQAELKRNLVVAFQELDSILQDHSGPFATNCVIGSKWRQVNDVDEFTKDGIKILRHLIVSEEPSARFAARMARFIGIAVDSRCHDGTTTSMLLFCRLAIIALEKVDDDFLSPAQYLWAKEFVTTLSTCMTYLEDLKITEDEIFERCKNFGLTTTIEDVRASIAYHMAMISSKGDDNLSTKIAAVIRSCPKKIYGMFKDSALGVETEEPYLLKKQEYDISMNANIGNIQDYNHRNDTQYFADHAVIFASGNEIVSDSMESLFLTAFISTDRRHRNNLIDFGVEKGWEELHGGKHHLIILSPLVNDPNLIMQINLFNMANPTVRISWFNVQVHGRMRTSLNKTLHYMAGIPLFQDVMTVDATASLIGLQETAVKAHLIGHTLTLTDLYEKDGEVFHPLFRDPELFEPYTRFARETEELIEFAKENITNPALDQDEVTYLTSLYRSLTCQEIYDIIIGGSAHDQYANRTVYEDAMGAALSAVNEGVVLGGYAHLARLFSYMLKDEADNGLALMFFETFTSIVEDSLRASNSLNTGHPYLCNLIETSPDDKWSYIAADIHKYTKTAEDEDYIQLYSLDKDTLEIFLSRIPDRTILLQAFGGYHEQFRRCRDILPKLANTTHLADMRVREGTDVH